MQVPQHNGLFMGQLHKRRPTGGQLQLTAAVIYNGLKGSMSSESAGQEGYGGRSAG